MKNFKPLQTKYSLCTMNNFFEVILLKQTLQKSSHHVLEKLQRKPSGHKGVKVFVFFDLMNLKILDF